MSVLYASLYSRALPTAFINHFNLNINVTDPSEDPSFAEEFSLKKVPALIHINEKNGK